MPWGLLNLFPQLPLFAAVLFRISGLVMTAPIYGSRLVPLRIRAALAFAAAAVITPLVRTAAPAELSLSAVVAAGMSELAVGALIGLTLAIFMTGAEVAGTVAGQQAGLALSRVVDPTLAEQTSVLGQVYAITLTLIFLVAGGHRAAMAAVLDSYRVIPLFSFQWGGSGVDLLVRALTAAFILGIRLAGPVLIALFLTGTAMAFLSRTMPQLNILTVGFTVRTMVVLAAAGLALNAAQGTLLRAVWDVFALIDGALGTDATRFLVIN